MSPKKRKNLQLGQVLRKLRTESRMSLREVAEVSQTLPEPIGFEYLSRVEGGHVTPGPEKLLTLATIYEIPGQLFLDAIELAGYEPYAPRTSDPDALAEAGLEAGKRGDFRTSYAAFLKALHLLESPPLPPEPERAERAAKARNDLAIALFRLGKPRLAQRHAESLLAQPGLSKFVECRALNLLSAIHYQLGQYSLAEATASAALRAARRLGDEGQLAQAFLNLANPRFEAGRHRLAASGYRRALGASEAAHRQHDVASALFNLGNCEAAEGHTAAAEEYFRRGLVLARELSNSRLESWGLTELGRLLAAAAREDEAREAFTAARTIALSHDYLADAFHSTYHLWKLDLRAGRGADAVGLFKALRKLRLQVDQRSEEVVSFDAYLTEVRARSRSKGARHERASASTDPPSSRPRGDG